uniref:ABC-type cobalt transport system permease component CbiQ n=1 Tax=Candidatus Actinomarina minuta TaxID=1389454 RepID=S5DWW6_9ACTN|nr:ABC-type cobalt transport system permease component CbiQ [Candidatus Actinomarina minuta]
MQTTHSHHLSLHSKSQLHELSPQLKILSTLLIVISIAFSKIINPFQIISHAVIVFLIIRFSNIPLKTYLKRLTLDIPFILFALFLPFLSSGNNDMVFTLFTFEVYRTGLLEMFAILFKATAGLSMGIILTATSTNIELIYGLQKLKVPPIIIAIMSFSIRYIDVFIDEFKRVRVSMQSRGYIEKGIKTLIPIAYASGAMLIRGYERGERVYLSMISRGFTGVIELQDRDYKQSNYLLALTIFSIIVLILDVIL